MTCRVLLAATLLSACSGDPPPSDGPVGDPADAFTPDSPPAADAFVPADSAPAGDGELVCGDKPLWDDCTDGIECDTCLCFTEGDRSYCSKPCEGPSDCPTPSQGCNLLHVCRPPS